MAARGAVRVKGSGQSNVYIVPHHLNFRARALFNLLSDPHSKRFKIEGGCARRYSDQSPSRARAQRA